MGAQKRGSWPAMVRGLNQRATKGAMIAEQKIVFGVKEKAPGIERRIIGVALR